MEFTAYAIYNGNIYTPAEAFRDDLKRLNCIDCGDTVILKAGHIRAWHFCHLSKECEYGKGGGESIWHKQAKYTLLKMFNEKKKIIILKKNCCNCDDNDIIEIYKKNNNYEMKLEYKYDENNLYKADIAIIRKNKLKYIIEIFYTHKTDENKRPEPWIELNALDILEQKFLICRREKNICIKCINKINQNELIVIENNTRKKIEKEEETFFNSLNLSFTNETRDIHRKIQRIMDIKAIYEAQNIKERKNIETYEEIGRRNINKDNDSFFRVELLSFRKGIENINFNESRKLNIERNKIIRINTINQYNSCGCENLNFCNCMNYKINKNSPICSVCNKHKLNCLNCYKFI